MQKIGDSTSTANAASEFTEGNAGAGVDATLLKAEWLNTIQRELVAVVQGVGLALDKTKCDQVLMAIKLIVQAAATNFAVDTGTAGVYKAAFTPAITALTDGTVVGIKIKTANPGEGTFSPDGLPDKPIVGSAHAALQGGEFVANGYAWFQYNSSIGAGSWVLIDSTGGASQVAPASKSQHAVQLGQVGHGQCQFISVSGTTVKLVPLNGNNLIINGVPHQIPAAGVTGTNGGLNGNIAYYWYAFWNGTSMVLEASTAGHSVDATTGVEIKTGDPSRTLVGWTQTNASAKFSDGAPARLVASYFNRRAVGASITTVGTLTFTSTDGAEISAGVRLQFFNWANEAVEITATGQYTNSAATQSVAVQSYVDAVPYGNLCGTYIPANGVGMAYATSNCLTPSGGYLSEGLHTAQIYGSVTAGTGSTAQMTHSLVTRI